jgi:hypothetical protein
MPDQTLDQLPEEIVPSDADLLYVVRNGADRKILRGALVDGLAPEARSILTAGGLSGGGDLSANRTLALDLAGLAEDTAPDPGADYVVTQDASAGVPRRVRIDRLPASGTGSAQATFASVAVPGQSTVTATQAGQTLTLSNGANVAITTNATTNTVTVAATGLVPATRSVSAGAGLAGGGTLAADRAVSLNIAGQSEDVAPVLANHYLITHDTAAGAFRRIRASLLGGGTYVLPAATSSVLGGVRVGAGLSVDVNGLLAATYALPTATASALGGVKVGAGLAVDSGGVLSAALPVASSTTLGGVRVGAGLSSTGTGVLSVNFPAAYSLPVAGASVLGGVKVGAGLAIDGTGILSATGGGGGGGGTFATQAEAEAGTSTTTYMSPARTREALTSYAAANELTGTDGQVVRFNAAGDAVAANNTRAVMVPVFAESAAVATGTAIRKFRWPVGLRLTQVEVYTPTPGSTATTVDVAVGSSIFNAPPSVAGGSSATTVTAFAQATVAKAAVCEIAVTAAGTGARGLWVTFTGIET